MEVPKWHFTLLLGFLFECSWPRAYSARGRHSIIWTKVTCGGNPSYVEQTECIVDQPNRVTFNVTTSFRQPIAVMKSNVSLDLVRPPRGEAVHLFHLIFDNCAFLEGSKFNRFIELIYDSFMKYGNFPKKCPVEAQKIYTLTNFALNADRIPAFMPTTDFHFTIDMSLTDSEKTMRFFWVDVRGRLQEHVNSRFNRRPKRLGSE